MRFAAAVGAFAVASVVAGCGVVAGTRGPPYVVDDAVVAEWEHTLSPAFADIAAIGDLSGLRLESAPKVFSCGIDDSDNRLFDLQAWADWAALDQGEWVVPDPTEPERIVPEISPATARGVLELVRGLEGRGWVVTDREVLLGTQLPPGLSFDTVTFVKRVDGVKTEIDLQASSDGAWASFSFDGARKACRLA